MKKILFFPLKEFTTEDLQHIPQLAFGIWEFALLEGRDSGFRSKIGERFGVENMHSGMRDAGNNHRDNGFEEKFVSG